MGFWMGGRVFLIACRGATANEQPVSRVGLSEVEFGRVPADRLKRSPRFVFITGGGGVLGCFGTVGLTLRVRTAPPGGGARSCAHRAVPHAEREVYYRARQASRR